MGPKVEIEEVHSSNVELVIRVEVRDGVTSIEVVKWLQTIAAPGSSFQIHVVSETLDALVKSELETNDSS